MFFVQKLLAVTESPFSKAFADYEKLVLNWGLSLNYVPRSVLCSSQGEALCLQCVQRRVSDVQYVPKERLVDNGELTSFGEFVLGPVLGADFKTVQYMPAEFFLTQRGFEMVERFYASGKEGLTFPREALVEDNGEATDFGVFLYGVYMRKENLPRFELPKTYLKGELSSEKKKVLAWALKAVFRREFTTPIESLVVDGVLTPFGEELHQVVKGIGVKNPMLYPKGFLEADACKDVLDGYIQGGGSFDFMHFSKSFFHRYDLKQYCEDQVRKNPLYVNDIPGFLWVTDEGELTELGKSLFGIILKDDAGLKEIPNVLSLSKDDDDPVFLICKKISDCFADMPESLTMVDGKLTILGRVYYRDRQTIHPLDLDFHLCRGVGKGEGAMVQASVISWRHSLSVMDCQSMTSYVEKLREVNKKSLQCHLFTESSFQDPSSRAVLESGVEGDVPIVLVLRANSKFNGLDGQSRTVDYMPGCSITLNDSVKVVYVVDRSLGETVSPDVLSRVEGWHVDPVLELVNSQFDGQPFGGGSAVKTVISTPDFNDSFDRLCETVGTLRLAEKRFSGLQDVLLGTAVGDCVVLRSSQELEAVEGLELKQPVERLSVKKSCPPASMCVRPDELVGELSGDYLPLFASSGDVDRYCRFLLDRAGVLDYKQPKAEFFESKTILLPIEKQVDLYKAVFKSSSGDWFFRYGGDDYKVKDVRFYDPAAFRVEDVSTASLSLDAEDLKGWKRSYYSSSKLFTKTEPGSRIIDGLASLLTQETGAPIRFFEGPPAIGKDAQLELALGVLKKMGKDLEFCSVTAGSDMPLLLQIQEAVSGMAPVGAGGVYVVKVSEINLCHSDDVMEVLSWARFNAIPLKIVGTQNSSSISESRFLTEARFSGCIDHLPDFDIVDLHQILYHMLDYYNIEHLVNLSAIMLDFLAVRAACSGDHQPTIRLLSQIVRHMASADLSQLSGSVSFYKKYLPANYFPEPSYYYYVNQVALRDSPLDPNSLADMSMTFNPGEVNVQTRWKSVDNSPVSLSVPMCDAHDLPAPTIRFCESGGSVKPSGSMQLGIRVGPSETVRLRYFLDLKNSVTVRIAQADGAPIIDDHKIFIKDGMYCNPYFHDVFVYVVSENPVSRFSHPDHAMARSRPGNWCVKRELGPHSEQDRLLLDAFVKFKGKRDVYECFDLERGCSSQEVLTKLYTFFNGFSQIDYSLMPMPDGDVLDDEHLNLYWSLINAVGVCRHQSRLFEIVARELGVYVATVCNEEHVFVVGFLGENGECPVVMDLNYFQYGDVEGPAIYEEIKSFVAFCEGKKITPVFARQIESWKKAYLFNPHIYSFIDSEHLEFVKTINREVKEAKDRLKRTVKKVQEFMAYFSDKQALFEPSLFNRLGAYLSDPKGNKLLDADSKIIDEAFSGLDQMPGEQAVSMSMSGGARLLDRPADKSSQDVQVVECSFDVIDDYEEGDDCFWTEEDVYRVISQDKAHAAQSWLALQASHTVEWVRKAICKGLAYSWMDHFPKGRKELVTYKRAGELGGESNRVSYTLGEGDDRLCVIRTSVPCSSSEKVRAIFSNPALARAYADENGDDGVYVITDQGPFLYASLGGGAGGGRALDLSGFEKGLCWLNETLKAEGYPEVV